MPIVPPPALPFCPARRDLPDDPDTFFCAHPSVHARNDLVTAEICEQCRFRQQAPPDRYRTFVPRPGLTKPRSPPRDVAVAILCTGHCQHLEDTVASALAQVPPPCEVVVVDLVGNDETARLIAESSFRSVRYVATTAASPGEALREAVGSIKAAVLCLVGADDFLSPRFLATGLREFADADVALVLPRIEPFGAGSVQTDWPCQPAEMHVQAAIPPLGSLIRRPVYEFLHDSGQTGFFDSR